MALALVMVATLCVGILAPRPPRVYAAEQVNASYYDPQGSVHSVAGCKPLAEATRTSTMDGGTYVLESGEMRFAEGIEVTGRNTLIIGDAQLVVEGKGVHVADGASLTICSMAGQKDKGRIYAYGPETLFDLDGDLVLNGCTIGGGGGFTAPKHAVVCRNFMSCFEMNSGTVSGCTSYAVLSEHGGWVRLYGGTVTDNEYGVYSCSTDEYGMQVPVGWLLVKGAPVVAGNRYIDLMLGDNEEINVDGRLTDGCNLVVSRGGNVRLTNGYHSHNGDDDPNRYFTNAYDHSRPYKIDEKGEVLQTLK